MTLTYFGQAGWKVKTASGKIIYIDPWMGDYQNESKADLILVTHSHHDHSDTKVLGMLKKDNTIIITSGENAIKIHAQVMAEGEKKVIEEVEIEAVPAYNTNKNFHPRGFGLGFVLTIEGKRIYHAGDTDVIPEMKNLGDIDLALLPIGGTYTMNAEEATKAVRMFNPKTVIPMHYNTPSIGLETNENDFKTQAESQTTSKAIILKPSSCYEL